MSTATGVTTPRPVSEPTPPQPRTAARRLTGRAGLAGLAVVVIALTVTSLLVGAQPLDLAGLVRGDSLAWLTFTESRVPRTAAILLAGSALGMIGLIVQLLARNRFVEPGTIGSTDSAALALVLVSAVAPGAPVALKIVVGVVGALLGTGVFFGVISRFKHRAGLIIPLVGLVIGSVISALTSFLAFRFDLVQSLGSWMSGSFSSIIGGRYELLWLVLLGSVAAWWAADRLTAAGMGEAFARNLGINHNRVLAIGLVVVAVVSAIIVVVVGGIPFLGLVVPNLVRMLIGDNLRRSLPWIALGGAGLVLACDILARVVRFPYEVPVSLVIGILCGTVFLALLVRQRGAS